MMTMPMSTTTRQFDAARYLVTEDDVLGFLDAASEGWDLNHLVDALAVVARSEGMNEVTARTGVTPERLTAMLAEAPSTMARIYDILDALGLAIRLERKAA